MSRKWRATAVAMLAAGTLAASQAPAFAAAGGAAPTITIGASSLLPVVTHDVWVVYHAGKYGKATVSGQITGAADGEVVTIYAQQFPFKKPPVSVGASTLSSPPATAPYSFTVRPNLATRYYVTLTQGTTQLATSATQPVYVDSAGYVTGGRKCKRPVCTETFHVTGIVPASALKTEMSKHVYPYFGLRLAAVTEPPPPKWLHLNAGHAHVSKPKRLSATRWRFTVRYTFRIGNHAYHWAWAVCTRDSVAKDGLGLPGHHGCGAKRVRYTAKYLGAGIR